MKRSDYKDSGLFTGSGRDSSLYTRRIRSSCFEQFSAIFLCRPFCRLGHIKKLLYQGLGSIFFCSRVFIGGAGIPDSVVMARWVPLESNPEVLTQFARKLGLPSTYCLTEVYSPDFFDVVPQPRLAVVFLFPTTLPQAREAPSASSSDAQPSKLPYLLKQTVGNACGTIALLHAMTNNFDTLETEKDSFIDRFYRETKDMSPAERAEALLSDKELDKVHASFAQQGQTKAPEAAAKVDWHFVCFVEKDGWLYELDGKKEEPTRYGQCEKGKLLEESFKVIQAFYMSRDPNETRFNVLALTPDMDQA